MNVYDSIIEGAQELTPAERGQLYTAVLEYLYYEREPEYPMKPAPKAVYVAMRPVLDNQLSAARRGRKGGRPKKQKADDAKSESKPKAEVSENEKPTETSAFQNDASEAKPTESEQEQEQELIEEPPKGGKKKRAKFVPPTVAEVDEYLAARGLAEWLSGTEFVGYYGSQDWRKANGQPVTNWKLAAAGWADRERKRRGGEHDYGSWEY